MGAPRASLASMRMRERLRDPARVTRRSDAERLPRPVGAKSSASEPPPLSAVMRREWNWHAACPAPALTTRKLVEWHRSRPRSVCAGAHECSAE